MVDIIHLTERQHLDSKVGFREKISLYYVFQIKNAKNKQRMMATKDAKRIAMRIASMHTKSRSKRNIIMTPIETATKTTLKMAMRTPINNVIFRANASSNVSQDSREEDSNTEEIRKNTVR